MKGEEYIAIRIAFFLITLSLLISINLNADELVIDVPTNIGNTDVSITEFGGSSTIITEDDIESSGATEIYQLLRTVPGLSVKRSGARGGMISIFARGSESDHNLVLIDGVRANDIGGGFNFEFLSLNNIEMIEILRGPQSALYGSGAMGSVISITTKKPGAKTNASFKSAIGFNQGPKKNANEPLLNSQTNGGKYFVNEQYFRINGPITRNDKSDIFVGYSIGYERINDDGFRRFNDSYENGILNSSILLKTIDEKLKILLNMTRRKAKYHYPTNDSGSVNHTYAKTQRDRRHTTTRSLNFEYNFINSLTYGTTYQYNYLHKWWTNSTVQVSKDLNWWEKREGFNYYLKSNNNLGFVNIKTLIGYDKVNESSNYDIFNASGFGGYYGHDDGTKSYYGNLLIKAPYSVVINPGVRRNEHDTHGNIIIPSLFISKKFEKTGSKIRGGYSKGIKYPQIYESSAASQLKAERNKSYEIGFDQTIGNISAISVTYFNTTIYDIVAYRPVGETYQNLDEAKSEGYEFSGNLNLPYDIRTKAWYTFLDTKSYNTNNTIQSSSYNLANWLDDEPLLRRPKHSGGFSIGQYKNNYTVNINGIYIGGRWDFENSFARKWNKHFWDFNLYADYTLVNNGLYESDIKTFINVENLFHDKRQEILNITSPGRTIMVGIKLNI